MSDNAAVHPRSVLQYFVVTLNDEHARRFFSQIAVVLRLMETVRYSQRLTACLESHMHSGMTIDKLDRRMHPLAGIVREAALRWHLPEAALAEGLPPLAELDKIAFTKYRHDVFDALSDMQAMPFADLIFSFGAVTDFMMAAGDLAEEEHAELLKLADLPPEARFDAAVVSHLIDGAATVSRIACIAECFEEETDR